MYYEIKSSACYTTQIPLYTLPSNKAAPQAQYVVHDKEVTSGVEKWRTYRVQNKQACLSDRFIPTRRRQNFAASNYYLTRVPPPADSQNQIDVFDQILKLESTWRKKLMKSALERSDLLPSTGQQRVLNIVKPLGANRESYGEAEKVLDDGLNDGTWKTKARKQPILGRADITVEVSSSTTNSSRGLLDWGSTHFIAALIDNSMVVFDGSRNLTMSINRTGQVINGVTARTRMVKWNNTGSKIAVCTKNSEIMIHDFISNKLVWRRECRCTRETSAFNCEVMCVAWSSTDAEIVVGCSEGRMSSYTSSTGTLIETEYAHYDIIITIAFSPNNRYVASTSIDKTVRIVTWPSLMPYMAIGYYAPVQALAWHPWEVDKLCVGGGFDDGSLSLWDIRRQTSLGYRKVPFMGVVKNMTWNKLSGELVVQWNYQHEDSVRAVVPVLSSLDRVVDLVGMTPRVTDIVWNPNGTQLAMRVKNFLKVWNFFGNETSNWYDEEENRKRVVSAGRIRNFDKYSIR